MAVATLHSATIADVLLGPGEEFTTVWNNPPMVVNVFLQASLYQAAGGNWCEIRLLDVYEKVVNAPTFKRMLIVKGKNTGGTLGWAAVSLFWAT